MFYHDGAIGWHHAGNFAVQVFFALSGWLIGGILLKMDPSGLPRFFFNRAIRLWIPYYIALFCLLFVSVIREPITYKWLEIVAYKVTFVYNLFGTPQLLEFAAMMPQKGTLTHVWSVNAEEQFYLLAPLLLVLLAKQFGRSTLVWAFIAFLRSAMLKPMQQ
jgi:peptidoglycan/LPS O-acetylase OafA/YrhL